MRSYMLNLLHVTRGVLRRPYMGDHALWTGKPFMDLSISRVQHSPSVYFPLSVALVPFFKIIGSPTRGFFTLPVNLPPRDR